MRNGLRLFAVIATLALAGCRGDTPGKTAKAATQPKASVGHTNDDAEIQAALAKLPEEDRKLAEAQKWCAVQNKNRLGSMDTPYRIMVKGEPVFLCCEGCEKKALADPDKTLAKVEELKKKAASSSGK
jgi:hypothetical protein